VNGDSQSNSIKGDILIVDDSTPNLRLLSIMLTEHGYTVRGAPDGLAALTTIEQAVPDLILLDIIMPHMDGYEVCEHLKRSPKTRDIPIIFISALDEVGGKVRGFQVGGVDYITKPFKAEEVLARVQTHLTLRHLQKQLEDRNAQLQHEILERQWMQLALQKANEELEQRVERRTTNLVEANASLQTEITERERIEAALRASESRYRDLFENAYDLIQCVAPDAHFIFVNQMWLETLGYTSEELPHLTLPDILHPAVRGAYMAAFQRALQGEPQQNLQTIFATKEGGEIEVEGNLTCQIVDGKVVESYGIFRDTTDRKKLEAELRQSQKMEAIGRLAGGIAHDFNNLLTVINGYSALLLNHIAPHDPRHKDIIQIKQAGERAASLTNQLLAFSRRQVLQPKTLSLNTVVADMEKILRRLIGEDVELVIKYALDLSPVKADPSQLEQVILNLALNARDAMPWGGTLSIETTNAYLDHPPANLRPGPYVTLTISDTGCGMDEETLSHIFEPFFTTKEYSKGTGLGLSTVYGIINQSEGGIQVYSRPREGAIFKIYLPKANEPIQSDQQSLASLPNQNAETILLVEDEPMVLELACRVLLECGYTVLKARNGDEALQLCGQHPGPIHLLVTDVIMPEMNGRELAEHIALRHPPIKVLYMSGYTDDVILHHGLLEPGIAFLQKPFTPTVLLQKVRQVLG
jgi:PAS domain S-box-containing protein